jgi:HD-like signal output (HDOD) protein
MLNKLRNNLKSSKGIPALESTVNDILAALHDDKRNIKELIQLITNDISLTQKILKLANSAMYLPFAQDVSTISDALRVLGSKAIVHIVLSVLLINEDELDTDEELAKILLAAEFAKHVSSEDDFEHSAIATLLYNVGKLLVSKYLKDEALTIYLLVQKGIPSEAAEKKVLGMTFQDLGVEMSKSWNLPKQIISVIDGTGDPALINIAKFSNSTAAFVQKGNLTEANKLLEALDIPTDRKLKMTTLMFDKVEAIILKAKPLTVEVKKEITLDDILDTICLDNLLIDIGTKEYPSLELFTDVIFPKIQFLLKTTHCLLLTTKNNVFFKASFGVGENISFIINSFVISIKDKPNVLQAALANNADISISDISKFNAKSLPDIFREILPNTKKLIALPIYNKLNVVGLFYLDWEVLKDLSSEEISLLKKTRNSLVKYFK